MKRIHQLVVNDEGFVFDPTTGKSFMVNAIGLSIMKALQACLSTTDIVNRMQQEYVVDQVKAERDVNEFIQQLESYHWV